MRIDYLLGCLVAIPFAYPYAPFYPIAYFIFFISLFKIKCNRDCINYLILIGFFIILIYTVNFFNNSLNISTIGTYSIILFLLVKYSISNFDSFFKGILSVTTLYSIITIILFFYLQAYSHGFSLFTNSTFRMWGEGYLLEWPNVFACFVVIGGFISLYYSRFFLLSLHLISSLLTTSRISLIFIFLVIFILFINSKYKKTFFILSAFSCICILLFVLNQDDLINRITKFSDRNILLQTMISIFKDNLFGIGNISFSEFNTHYMSYHSSFLKVLIRYGFIGLLFYLILIFPRNIIYNNVTINALILTLLVCGIFQDFLFHPHIIIIYAVLIQFKVRKEKYVYD